MSLDELVTQQPTRRDALKALGLSMLGLALNPDSVQAQSSNPIINQSYMLPARRTRRRNSTNYIILHTTEGEFGGAMNKIRRHANANYVLNKDGTIYSVVQPDYWSNHAGRSMWRGQQNLSSNSVGIEIVGYHYAPLTARQYQSLKPLVEYLQRRYNLSDDKVLAHYQIAYDSNRWTRGRRARGRRKDGINIDWKRLGINHVTQDPDVIAGRVIADPFLAAILAREGRGIPQAIPGVVARAGEDPAIKSAKEVYGSNVIEQGKSAWSLVGDQYNQSTTFYVTPDNSIIAGNRVGDWDRLPIGTKVFGDTDFATVQSIVRPIITIRQDQTVWSLVQNAYNDSDTCYVLPNTNEVFKGPEADSKNIIPGTRIVLNCTGPHNLNLQRTPFSIAGKDYDSSRAIYLYPNGEMRNGSQITNYSALPRGIQMLMKKN